jgi:predicted LPLAT superfamily acyltransferase
VVAQLEAIVRRYPWQWFQFAPFWPEPEVAAREADEEASVVSQRGIE